MNIYSFGLPNSFPEPLVPAAALEFMLEHRGQSLETAIDAGNALGFHPTVWPVAPQIGGFVYGFGIVVERVVVPFVVHLSEFPAGRA
ncbi:hypothetical protein PCO31111_04216 [Pandoraea communis]|uniref:Uncharacterized protein n=1 Tax=Pandoraea communis TaxID=2508297 RepID=A0A5E4XZQ1_9BURK|nr:hypothetical protein [Pandoraea communis]VVE41830.1 hypothetical protein PCO31111_04216 [Pandoraea communis]